MTAWTTTRTSSIGSLNDLILTLHSMDLEELSLREVSSQGIATSTLNSPFVTSSDNANTLTALTKAMSYQYKQQDPPDFKHGKISSYPGFKKEFRTSVEPGKTVSWIINQLNRLYSRQSWLVRMCKCWRMLEWIGPTLCKSYGCLNRTDGGVWKVQTQG